MVHLPSRAGAGSAALAPDAKALPWPAFVAREARQ